MTTWEMRSNQKPKRCTAQYPFTGTFQNGHRCTLEVGHTGPHTILPPSWMDYAQDDDPRVTAERMEKARRLSRYDEAIRLLRMISGMAVHWEPLTPGDIREVNNFLAAEPADKEPT